MYRKLELDESVFRRSHTALRKALQGGNQLTRDELRQELRKAGIQTDGEFRMGYVLMQAELEGVICKIGVPAGHVGWQFRRVGRPVVRYGLDTLFVFRGVDGVNGT